MIKFFDLTKLKKLYDTRMVRDFPPLELPSYFILRSRIINGILEVLSFEKDGKEVAYAVCAFKEKHVLLMFFSVFEKYRNQGIGTEFLKELETYYSDKAGILIEVEKPECAENEGKRIVTEKRIKFYEKSGYILLKDIEYIIWDVPMYLMLLPLSENHSKDIDILIQQMKKIYSTIYRHKFKHKLKISLKS